MALQTIILLLVSLLLSASQPLASESNPDFFRISRNSYTASEICARCHKDIYANWKESMHAKAVEDPVFMADFLMVQLKRGPQVKEYCLSCHAPTTRVTEDYDLRGTASNEGVACDFCHTVSGLGLIGKPDYYKIDKGITKYGPFRDTESPAHETQYSEIHTKSEFCAGCHELVNGNGVLVMGTFSEWKEGPYSKEGIQCQNCHMPIVYDKNVVDPSVKESSHFVTAHEFRGGHSVINLTNAAVVRTEVEREGDVAKVVTRITNSESGHKLPTGTPARKVVLNTRIIDPGGNLLAEVNKVYRKVLVDDDGIILEDNAGMILNAAQIFSDNRIAPGETRTETFKFDIPDGVDMFTVENTLQYEFSRPILRTEKIVYQMSHEVIEVSGGHASSQVLSTDDSSGRFVILVLAMGVLVIGLLVFFRFDKKKLGTKSSLV